MPFERPTLSQLVSNAVADIQTNITGAVTLLRRSTLKILARVQAGVNHLLYGFLDYQSKGLFVTSSDEIQMKTHGVEWNIDRDEAHTAVGNMIATGTTGLVVTEGKELEAADGIIYTVDEDTTLVGGTAITAITAQQTGADGNQDAATVLLFVSPIPGIDSDALVDSDGLSGGEDIETVDSWGNRILARKRNPPHGGAEHDYINWMLEVDGVSRSWVFPLYNGVGTVGVAFVRDEEIPIVPSADEIAVVRAYIVQHVDEATGKTVGIPVTAEPGLFSIVLVTKAIDLTISLSPNTGVIQTAVTALVNDALVEFGGPGETVYLSQLQKAIAATADLDFFRIDLPVTDITATQTEVHVPGTYTYTDY